MMPKLYFAIGIFLHATLPICQAGGELDMVEKFVRSGFELGKKSFKQIKKAVLPAGASDIVMVEHGNGILGATSIKVNFGMLEIMAPLAVVKMYVNGKAVRFRNPLKVAKDGVLERSLTEEELDQIREISGSKNLVWFHTTDDTKTLTVDCTLFVWRPADKLVIVDIDGTVTKSDVIGMVLEEDWMQNGILPLFKVIQKMGYKFVYLSARPAAMGTKTRNFLKRSQLPIGPVLLSREKLWKAFKTATTNPEKIKIHGLIDLQGIFGGNPFWAGFGNQETDLVAYKYMQIPFTFIINSNKKVEVRCAKKGYKLETAQKSYTQMAFQAQKWFPRIGKSRP